VGDTAPGADRIGEPAPVAVDATPVVDGSPAPVAVGGSSVSAMVMVTGVDPDRGEGDTVGRERETTGRDGDRSVMHVPPSVTHVPPSAGDELNALLGTFEDTVRASVHVWGADVAREVDALRTILARPGSRSLIFGTGWADPVWVLNVEGSLAWFEHNATPVSVPPFTGGSFAAIHISDQGQLTGPARRAPGMGDTAADTGARTGFCDVTLGSDLSALKKKV
jgi:hypothetical protein